LEWRNIRGDAILSAIGMRGAIVVPSVGTFEIYLYGEWLLQFRGGRHKPWWDGDCKLLVAIVNAHSVLHLRGACIIEELDGALSEYYVEAPVGDEAQQLVAHALQAWQTEGRIPKNSPRAYVCHFCAAKRSCDATDVERQETHDWPPAYRAG
jgi:hypothetical protein